MSDEIEVPLSSDAINAIQRGEKVPVPLGDASYLVLKKESQVDYVPYLTWDGDGNIGIEMERE